MAEAHYDAAELIATDDDIRAAGAAIHRADGWHTPLGHYRPDLQVDTLRVATATVHAVAPAIARRVLEDLVRHCFDEADALIAEGGINTIEQYVAARLDELRKAGA